MWYEINLSDKHVELNGLYTYVFMLLHIVLYPIYCCISRWNFRKSDMVFINSGEFFMDWVFLQLVFRKYKKVNYDGLIELLDSLGYWVYLVMKRF